MDYIVFVLIITYEKFGTMFVILLVSEHALWAYAHACYVLAMSSSSSSCLLPASEDKIQLCSVIWIERIVERL